MKPVVYSNWTNPDLRVNRSYVTSYTLRQGNNELFHIRLNKQLGFYTISEFVSPASRDGFILEQTNKVGKPKIAVFEKDTGLMLGVLKGNTLLNENEEPVFDLKRCRDVIEHLSLPYTPNHDDFVALNKQREAIAIYSLLPKQRKREGVIGVLRQIGHFFSGTPQEVLELQVFKEDCCDIRMLYAIGIILHSRRGTSAYS